MPPEELISISLFRRDWLIVLYALSLSRQYDHKDFSERIGSLIQKRLAEIPQAVNPAESDAGR